MRESIRLACALSQITGEVLHERQRFPERMASHHVAYAVIQGDLYRLQAHCTTCARESNPDELRRALTHIAATACRALEDLKLV